MELKVYSLQHAAEKFGQSAAFIVTIWKADSTDRMAERREQLLNLNCRKVVSFGYLFWKYPEVFLPHYALDLPHKVILHADEVRKVFSLWADVDSQQEYLAQIRWRLILDFDILPSPVSHESVFHRTTLSDLLPDYEFVDCGAYDGDSIRNVLHGSQGYFFKKITAFEPDPANFKKLQQFALSLPANISNKLVL